MTLTAEPIPVRSEDPGKELSARKVSDSQEVPIYQVAPMGLNNRTHFDPEKLADLAADIRQRGILQPLIVRPASFRPDQGNVVPPGVFYELVAGERRWRAAKEAGLTTVPVRIMDLDDEQAQITTIIENIHRQDLDPIEEARGYQALRNLGMKLEQIAAQVNRSPEAVSNRIRLLKLPEEVLGRISEGVLSPSHGINLLRFEEYPPVILKLAEIAAARKAPAKDLEKGVPYVYDLERAELVKSMYPHLGGFDWEKVCPECPHSAYRREGSLGVCFRPAHFHELAEEARREKAEAQRKEALERLSEARPEIEREKIEAALQQIPSLSDLPNARRVLDPPKGCTKSCECRSSAVDYDGEIVAVCTDRSRFEALDKADRDARLKADEAAAVDLAERACLKLSARGLTGWEAALLIDPILDYVRYLPRPEERIQAAFADLGMGSDRQIDANEETRAYLAQFPADRLIKAFLRLIFLADAERAARRNYGWSQQLTRWYLSEKIAKGWAGEMGYAGVRHSESYGAIPVIEVEPERLLMTGDITGAYSYETVSAPYGKRSIERPVEVEGRLYTVTGSGDGEADAWELVEGISFAGQRHGAADVLAIDPKVGKFDGLVVFYQENQWVMARPVRFVAKTEDDRCE